MPGTDVKDGVGISSEEKFVGVPKFYCTMPLTNIWSEWMSNASSGLCINYIQVNPFNNSHFGV